MSRPMPLAELIESLWLTLRPAPEVWKWLQAEILADTGSIHNEDHARLIDADIQVMWASSCFEKQGRTVLGQAEQVAFHAGGWQKARMEQQMRDWFGEVPAFIITLAADYCAQCSDAEFCALVEHELYHLAHATDKYGQPAFTQDGASPRTVPRRSSFVVTTSKSSSAWFGATARALTCSSSSMLRAGRPRWPISTFRGPAEPVCSSWPDLRQV